MIRKIATILLVIFISIQFIRPAPNNGSSVSDKDISHIVHVPDTVKQLLTVSCYDCHSNHTVYPWYAYINPVGLWLNNHIEDGKRAINFSDLSAFSQKSWITGWVILLNRLKNMKCLKVPICSYINMPNSQKGK